MSKAEIVEFLEGAGYSTVEDTTAANAISPANYLQQPFDIKLKISENEIKLSNSELLGQGQYGCVWRGQYNEREVAVKTVKPYTDKVYIKALLSELKIMSYLGSHKNVIQLIGAVTDGLKKGICLVLIK